jgi:hypothetical protein
MRQRLDRLGAAASFVLSSIEEEGTVARSLQHLLRAKPTVVLIASTTAPAGPEDVVGRATIRAGCQMERFLAPVEPGRGPLPCLGLGSRLLGTWRLTGLAERLTPAPDRRLEDARQAT